MTEKLNVPLNYWLDEFSKFPDFLINYPVFGLITYLSLDFYYWTFLSKDEIKEFGTN